MHVSCFQFIINISLLFAIDHIKKNLLRQGVAVLFCESITREISTDNIMVNA